MKLYTLIIGLASLLLLAGCAETTATDNADTFESKLSGKVVDKNGDPVKDVDVVEVDRGNSATTEDDGTFLMSKLESGSSYKLFFHKNDWQERVIEFEIELGLLDSQDVGEITLVFSKTKISGTVIDGEDNPVLNVGVVIEQQGISAITTGGGEFNLPHADPGTITLMYATGQWAGTVTLETEADNVYDNIQLVADQTGGEFIGRIVEQVSTSTSGLELKKSGSNYQNELKPIEGAEVSAIAGILRDTTDRNGFFNLGGIPAGVEILLTIAVDGDTMFVHGVQVEEGGVTNLSNIIFASSVTENGITLIPVETRAIDTSTHMALIVSAFTTGNVEIVAFEWDTDNDGSPDDTTAQGVLILPIRPIGTYGVGVRAVGIEPGIDPDSLYSSTAIVNIVVGKPPSDDATLSGMSLTVSDIVIDFDPDTTYYEVTIPDTLNLVALVLESSDPNAILTFNGEYIFSGVPTDSFSVSLTGDTAFINVTPPDLSDPTTYIVFFKREKNDETRLNTLSFSSELFNIDFDPDIYEYDVDVPFDLGSLTLQVEPLDGNAQLLVNNEIPEGDSARIAFDLGGNVFTIQVVAENGTDTATYTFNVTRLENDDDLLTQLELEGIDLDSAFTSSVFSYNATVPAETESITLYTRASDDNASMIINGNSTQGEADTTVIPLDFGDNQIEIKVVAQNGTDTSIYLLNIERLESDNASLSSLSIEGIDLNPEFSATEFSYDATVNSGTTTITLYTQASDGNASISINGSGSGDEADTSDVSLDFGSNQIEIMVVAQNGADTLIYMLNVLRELSDEASLGSLEVPGTSIGDDFEVNTTTYHDTVGNEVTELIFSASAVDTNSTLVVNGDTLSHEVQSLAVPLNIADNAISIEVISQNGNISVTYALNIFRRLSPNSSLESMMVVMGADTIHLDSGTAIYNDTALFEVGSVEVIALTQDTGAVIILNGDTLGNSVNTTVNTNTGPNEITISVTAQNGVDASNYIVNVFRRYNTNSALGSLVSSESSLLQGFTSGTTVYNDTVPYSITSHTLTPTVQYAVATVMVAGVPVASGNASAALNLNPGDNSFDVEVTAEDGVTQTTYTVNVYRDLGDNTLLTSMIVDLIADSILYEPGTSVYNDTITFSTSSVNVSAITENAGAVLVLNGDTLSNNISQSVNTNTGPNVITLEIIAENGSTTDTLIINLFREYNTNSALASLTSSEAGMLTSFSSGTLVYHDTLDWADSIITLTPTLQYAAATVEVDGVPVGDGTPSGNINLAVGDNQAFVMVTAEDTLFQTLYTVNVYRRPGNNGFLFSPGFSSGSFLPGFVNTTFSYTTHEFVFNSITLTPVSEDTLALITVNGDTVVSGTSSPIINFTQQGFDTVTVFVQSQDGTTSNTYTFVIYLDNMPPGISILNGDTVYVQSQGTQVDWDVVDSLPYEPSDKITSLVSMELLRDSTTPPSEGTQLSWIDTLQAGFNLVELTAVDSFGNTARDSAYVVLDTAAPQPVFDNTSLDTISNNPTISLTGNVTDDVGVKEISFDLSDGQGPQIIRQVVSNYVPGNTAFSIDSTWADGYSYLTIYFTDMAGREDTVSFTILVDTTPPQLGMQSFADRAKDSLVVTNNNNQWFAGSLFDDYGVVSVTYNFTGDTAFSDTAILDTGWMIGSLQIFGDSSKFTITATDSAGNTTTHFIEFVFRPGVIFVDKTSPAGLHFGGSWDDAFRELNNAITHASTYGFDTLWVAEGTYYPDESGSLNTSASFFMPANAIWYGGFHTHDYLYSHRSIVAEKDTINKAITVLSGDLEDNDAGMTHNGANSLRVLNAGNNTLLDGFRITSGAAGPGGAGVTNAGGMSINGVTNVRIINTQFTFNKAQKGFALFATSASSILLDNVTFKENDNYLNYATAGAAHFDNATATIQNSLFWRNNANDNNGGGLVIINTSGPFTVDATDFMTNQGNGGGVYLNNATADITNGNLLHNNATGNGGAVYVNWSDLNLDGVLIDSNFSANNGGGIYAFGDSLSHTLVIDNTNVNNNQATNNDSGTGGGLYVYGTAVSADGSFFRNNFADFGGGVSLSWVSSAVIKNGGFDDNTTTGDGAGIFLANAQIDIENTDFINNDADNNGGGIMGQGCGEFITFQDVNTFLNNDAGSAYNGGAIYNGYGYGGPTQTFTNNTPDDDYSPGC